MRRMLARRLKNERKRIQISKSERLTRHRPIKRRRHKPTLHCLTLETSQCLLSVVFMMMSWQHKLTSSTVGRGNEGRSGSDEKSKDNENTDHGCDLFLMHCDGFRASDRISTRIKYVAMILDVNVNRIPRCTYGLKQDNSRSF